MKADPPPTTTPSNKRKGSRVYEYFLLTLVYFGLFSILIATYHEPSNFQNDAVLVKEIQRQAFTGERRTKKSQSSLNQKESGPVKSNNQHVDHSLAGLSCDDHLGPFSASGSKSPFVEDMVYWHDIPADNLHVSPFFDEKQPRYLTFEPDNGGWNNIRMAMETALALAVAMGRTLVLPPEQKMYLLGKRSHRNEFSFEHFFHMDAIHHEHPYVNIISTEEFLKEQKVLNSPPPRNQTIWDGRASEFFRYLRTNPEIQNLVWDPESCIAYFPSSPTASSDDIQNAFAKLLKEKQPRWEDYVGKPVEIDSSPMDRLGEMLAGRKDLCLYNKLLQQTPVVHFPVGNKARLLVHFYAFLFFEDHRMDLWMKRFIRDHVRYSDEIQCAAARVIEAMSERVQKDHKELAVPFRFNAIHVRRGDFQYKKTRVSAEEILEQTQKKLPEKSILYVATDERNKAFFDPLRSHYYLYFLDDFMSSLGSEVNANFYGMIDQLVSSKSELFFGCWFSTFTGYITRLRGYHASRCQLEGTEEGKLLNSYYYVLPDRLEHLTEYYPVKKSFFAREFPTSWRRINVGMNATNYTQ